VAFAVITLFFKSCQKEKLLADQFKTTQFSSVSVVMNASPLKEGGVASLVAFVGNHIFPLVYTTTGIFIENEIRNDFKIRYHPPLPGRIINNY
jgi:hypothetical protein